MWWTTIEWLATILGLSGSLLMASKKISQGYVWTLWILSNILLICLFLVKTQQFGLFFMTTVGLLTSLLGIWQWSNGKEINIKAMKIAFRIAQLFAYFSVVLLIIFPFFPSIKTIEWFGAFLSISGALLFASKHKKSWLGWIAWLVSNMVLLLMTIYTKQWGIATLQLGFTISNIYGCFVWIYLKKQQNLKNTKLNK